LAFGGGLNADGQYVMVESIFPISKERNIYGVVSGFGHWGESDIRRGYINGGALASSKANVDSDTYGVRARVECLDAKTVAEIAVSPYLDVSYVTSNMDGYTEKSGPVLARFSSRSDDNTTFRLGFNATRPIAGTNFSLVANAEVAHATSDETGATTGQLAGTAFRVDGTKVHQDWVKAGFGAEGMIGKGMLMINGTSNSGLPNVWLAASYQMNF
jgi:outer membrane autotransporter protein